MGLTVMQYMDAVRSFQNAWNGILSFQLNIAQQLDVIYHPIHDAESNFNAESDPAALERASKLKSTYVDLENDLQQETSWIQTKLLQPAMDAKSSIAPLKKVIKKRDNYKLDYERYQSRVDHAKQKGPKNAKDEGTLARHETDMSGALNVSLPSVRDCTPLIDCQLYQSADDQIRKTMPAVIDAIQVLIPILLKEQIMLQAALVGQLYTVLHNYCQQFRFPSPAPPMEQVIATWERQFTPMRQELEGSFKILAGGKAIHQPMSGPEKSSSITGLGIRSRLPGTRSPSQQSVPQMRRTSSSTVDADEETPPPKPARPGALTDNSGGTLRIPSSMSIQSVQSFHSVAEDDELPPPKPPRPGGSPSPGFGPIRPAGSPSPGFGPMTNKPANASSLSLARSSYGTPMPGLSPTASSAALEIAEARRRSSASTPLSTMENSNGRPSDYFTQQRNVSTSSIASSIASKKKPPPPPVKRRVTGQDTIVTALYDFAGQSDGDLAFREGDRIKVVKKTDSTDDWWTGELHGVTGSFPANYVQV